MSTFVGRVASSVAAFARNPGKSRRGVPRRVLAVAAGIVVVQGLFVGVGAFRADREAAAASRQTLALVVDAERDRVEAYVAPSRAITHATTNAIASGNLDVDPESLPAILYGYLLTTPQVTGIHVATPGGAAVEVWTSGDGYGSRVVGSGDSPSDVTRTHTSAFATLTESATVDGSDPRTGDIFVGAIAAEGPSWTDPYVGPQTSLPMVSVAEVARSGTGGVLAVVWSDLGLDGLAETMSGQSLGGDGVAAVLGTGGAVIAVSSSPHTEAFTAGEPNHLGLSADDLGLEPGEPLGAGEDRRLVSSSSQTLAEEVRLQSPGGPDWTVHVQATQKALSPGIAALADILTGLAFGSFAVVLVGVLLGWWMTRPLKDLTRRATRDELTGLSNRADAMEHGERVIALARDAHRVACVLLCDLDNFKLINDSRGHSAGDAALEAVARALELEIRTGDVVGRWGGDEFLVVMTLPTSADTRRVVDRIREGVELELRRVAGEGLDVGLTIGYAESTEVAGGMQVMLDAADAALIAGKAVAKSSVYRAEVPRPSYGV